MDNERILIVDDETELVESSIRLLNRMGYHVIGETEPDNAIEILRNSQENFDLVITDLTMPTMTGIQLAQKIKDIKPDIPIILLSGFNYEAYTKDIDGSLIADFITKPIHKDDLVQVIRRVLDTKNS